MRKVVTVLVMLGLVAGSFALPAEAAKKKKKGAARIERVVEFEYDCPCGVRFGTPAGSLGVGWQLGAYTGSNTGGGEIPIGPNDLYVTAKAEDASGQNVRIGLANDTDGDGLNNTWGIICGETTEPIVVEQAEPVVRVFVTSGTCDDMTTPAFATGGTIMFTFSNMP